MRYVLNLGNRKLHDCRKADGRCKLKLINESNKMEFDSIEEAISYMPKGNHTIKFCTFCMKQTQIKENIK